MAGEFPARWTKPNWKPKPTGPKPRKPIRRKAKPKAERQQIDTVRAACVRRDGYCRGHRDGFRHTCRGPSEWAHLGVKRRSKTVNQAPEVRHTTADSLMLCRFLHRRYDAHEIRIEHGPTGCDGEIAFK